MLAEGRKPDSSIVPATAPSAQVIGATGLIGLLGQWLTPALQTKPVRRAILFASILQAAASRSVIISCTIQNPALTAIFIGLIQTAQGRINIVIVPTIIIARLTAAKTAVASAN